MLFLILIIIVLVVFPPMGLLLLGVFLYRLGDKWEKQQNREETETVREVKINEYDKEILEKMK